MEEQKRFQNQTLNSEDYEKTEEGAKALKNGGALLTVLGVAFGVGKKYGPALMKNLSKLRKIRQGG